ncbi:GerMN domain-containing protein [Acidipropionibacterium timonense]|uniref:GerMN domain-containing protein n=1 Tax=Acidipropionibacterium timonense TaxID=2161818 RepID=UPI00102F8F35|nr:GerMN domain-containing protein [Acidipropionibacterium timonense]
MTIEDVEDRDAWLPQACHELWRPLVRLAGLLLGRTDLAQQVVQDAFVSAYRRDPGLRSAEHLAEYLRTSVINRVRTAQRRSRSHPLPPEQVDPPTDPSASPVLAALRSVPRLQQEVLVLQYWADVEDTECAECLGISEGSVRSMRDHGLTALARALRSDGAEGEPLDDPRTEALLRSALEGAAERIRPGDRLDEILAAAHDAARDQARPGRRGVILGALGALAVGFGIPFIGGLSSDRSSGEVAATGRNGDTTDPQASGSVPTLQTGVPVYYVGRDDGLLYRELRDLPTLGDRLGTAVAAVLNVVPLDPDYLSRWSGGQVNSAVVKGNTIILDVSASAFAELRTRTAEESAIRQLVYTATAAVGDRTGNKTVRLLVDGSPNLPILGKPAADFVNDGPARCAPFWIDEPQAGAVVRAGTLRMSGVAQTDVTSMSYLIRAVRTKAIHAQGGIDLSVEQTAGWRSWSATAQVPQGELLMAITAGTRTVTRVISAQ